MDLPLLAKSAWIEGNEIVVLDETLLPERIEFIRCKDYRDVVRVIKEMRTRAYGQVLISLLTLILTAKKSPREDMLRNLYKAKEAIQKSRPTFPFKGLLDPFFYGITGETTPEEIEERVLNLIEDMNRKRIERAKRVASFIKDGDRILTHCNLSGELVIIGRICRKEGKEISFIVTETRPYFQGSRLTAWELSREGFDTKIIIDSAVANLMDSGGVDLVIVGSDRYADNGDIINKIGTYQIAIVAKRYGIPFFVLAQKTSDLSSGKEATIEIRDEDELLTFRGERITPSPIKGLYPAFDVTPAKFVDKVFFL